MKLTNKIFGLTFSILFSMDLHANELSRVIPEQNLQIKALLIGAGACALGVSCLVDVSLSKPLKNLLELHYYQKRRVEMLNFFHSNVSPAVDLP
jgi:hypothetical protein